MANIACSNLPFFASPTPDYHRSMHLTPEQSLALALDPALLFDTLSLKPDPWQTEVLRSNHPRILLNCCRQAGSTSW